LLSSSEFIAKHLILGIEILGIETLGIETLGVELFANPLAIALTQPRLQALTIVDPQLKPRAIVNLVQQRLELQNRFGFSAAQRYGHSRNRLTQIKPIELRLGPVSAPAHQNSLV
jgi:hypothetical protein